MEVPSHSWSALCRHQQKLSFLANDKRANQWCHNEHTLSTKMLRAGQMMNYGLQKFAGHLEVLFLNQQNDNTQNTTGKQGYSGLHEKSEILLQECFR